MEPLKSDYNKRLTFTVIALRLYIQCIIWKLDPLTHKINSSFLHLVSNFSWTSKPSCHSLFPLAFITLNCILEVVIAISQPKVISSKMNNSAVNACKNRACQLPFHLCLSLLYPSMAWACERENVEKDWKKTKNSWKYIFEVNKSKMKLISLFSPLSLVRNIPLNEISKTFYWENEMHFSNHSNFFQKMFVEFLFVITFSLNN